MSYFGTILTKCIKGSFNHFVLQDGYLFKDNHLCTPQNSLQEAIILEAHGSGLAGHFGRDLSLVASQFYGPRMERDIMKHLQRCKTCHIT